MKLESESIKAMLNTQNLNTLELIHLESRVMPHHSIAHHKDMMLAAQIMVLRWLNHHTEVNLAQEKVDLILVLIKE